MCGLCGSVYTASASPLTITDYMLIADKNNPDIAYLRGGVAVAGEEVSYAEQQYLPTPSISASEDNRSRRIITASLKQPLWTGGRLTAATEYAENKQSATAHQLNETRLNTFISVTQQWQRWLAASEKSSISARTLTRYHEYRELISRRIEGGRSSQSDLTLIDSRIAQAQEDYERAEMEQASSLSQLSQLTGTAVTSDNLSHSALYSPVSRELSQTVVDAVMHAPTVLRYEKEADAAKSESLRDKSTMYPEVSVIVSSDKAGNYSPDGERIMLNVSLTPGAGLSALSRYQSSQLKVLQAADQTRQAKLRLTNIISDLIIRQNNAITRLPVSQQRITSSDEVMKSYTRQFEYGQKTWNDLVNALRELSASELDYAELDAQMKADEIQLQLYTLGPDFIFGHNNGK